jgi:N-acyl homoserine lactone hydrolase
MSNYTIRPIPLVLGAFSLDARLFRSNIRYAIPHANTSFFIQGSRNNILVDSGVTVEDFIKHGSLGNRHIQTLPEGLARLGLKPEDIGIVVQTHLHFDHRSYATIFARARFIVQKAELDYHRSRPPYEPRPCPREVLDSLNWEVIEGDHNLEDGIDVLFTPGHTPGGQSLAVRTSKGLAVIEGLDSNDEIYAPPAGMEWTGSVATAAIHSDPEVAYRSAKRIKELAGIIVPLHEARWVWIDRIPW